MVAKLSGSDRWVETITDQYMQPTSKELKTTSGYFHGSGFQRRRTGNNDATPNAQK
jgi:hypothetical protein